MAEDPNPPPGTDSSRAPLPGTSGTPQGNPDPLRQVRHDLRTSVVHIVGYGELLQEAAEDLQLEGMLPDLQKIQASGKQLLDLIAELKVNNAEDAAWLDFERLRYDFRIGLNQVTGYSEMLAETVQDLGHPELGADLDKIRSAADTLLERTEHTLGPALLAMLDDGDQPAPPAAAPPPPEQRPASHLPPGSRLLVVDDDPANRDILARRLANQGFEVILAGDGGEALATARAQEFDLILLDIVMPGLDGYAVLGQLKADPVLRHVPVIMLSALDDADSVVHCLLLGAEDYLAKPFNPVILKTRVNACLEKHHLRRQLARKLRIFVSSPGDVEEERQRSQRVIEQLAQEFGNQVSLQPFFWEAEPLLATDTFQKQIITPAECDIFLCILWSRLGTRLPPEITRADGSRYDSGTQYEFENAAQGFRDKGSPRMLVYRKLAEPQISLSDRDEVMARLQQKEALDRFIAEWFESPEGEGFVAAFHGFAASDEFEEKLLGHLRKLVVTTLHETHA